MDTSVDGNVYGDAFDLINTHYIHAGEETLSTL